MRVMISFIYVFVGAVVFFIPNMTRRGVLFAVPVAANFRASGMGRQAIAKFRALIAAIVVVGLCGLLLSPDSVLGALVIATLIAVLMAGALGFFWQRHKLMPFAVQRSAAREAELSTAPDRLPHFTWLGAGPLAILAIAAGFLAANWERIPFRFPVHWGIDGQPDRWQERTTHGVYGPLLFAAELCVWLLIMGFATWFGARRSRFRRVVLGVLVAAEYMVAFLFSALSIEPVFHFPIWIPVVVPLVFIVPMLVVLSREVTAQGEPAEATPNECWKAGVFYYNPNDAALLVEKRTGLGYTLNFGNRWSWVLTLGLVLVVASGFVLL